MQLIQAFVDYLNIERKYSTHTQIAYQQDIESFKNFIKEEFEENSLINVHYTQIRSWIVYLVSKKVSNRTINRKISSLKTFYKFLQKTKQITDNPLLKHKALKVPKRINIPFTNKEITEVINNLNENDDFVSVRNKLVVEILYATGIRRNELINLKISDVDLIQENIKVLGKQNKERIIPLLRTVQNSIKKYLDKRKEIQQKNDYLFITEKGNKFYGTLVYRIINDYFSSVSTKVKKSPHIIRHAFATQLLNEGADLNSVKELLGHASLASTQVYTNSSLSELKKVYNQAHPRSKK